jgi:hypothetical protein
MFFAGEYQKGIFKSSDVAFCEKEYQYSKAGFVFFVNNCLNLWLQ